MKITKIEGIHFQPWVGENYYTSKYSKLLLLGESHYDVPEGDNLLMYSYLTRNMVNKFLKKETLITPFFKNIGLILNSSDYSQPWKDIAFANAIQNGLNDTKSQPDKEEDIRNLVGAFKSLLDYLKPSKVLVLSKRMWEWWLPEDNGNHVGQIKKGGKKSEIWEYKYGGGKCLAIGISHPSWMFGNSWRSWKPLVDEFLNVQYSIGLGRMRASQNLFWF